MVRASLGGVGQHGDIGAILYQKFKGLGGGLGDGGQLFRVGILIQAGIREEEGAVGAHLAVRYRYNEESGNQTGARFGLQNLQAGAQSVRGRVAGAGNHTVGIAHLNHHNSEIGVVGQQDLSGLFLGHSLLGTQLRKFLNICVGLLISGGIHDHGAGNVTSPASLSDSLLVADDDQVGNALLQDLLGSHKGTPVFALRKNDGLFTFFCSLFNSVNKTHAIDSFQ